MTMPTLLLSWLAFAAQPVTTDRSAAGFEVAEPAPEPKGEPAAQPTGEPNAAPTEPTAVTPVPAPDVSSRVIVELPPLPGPHLPTVISAVPAPATPPPPPRPIRWRVTPTAEFTSFVTKTRSWQAFHAGGSVPALGATLRADYKLGRYLALGGGLGYRQFSRFGNLTQAVDTAIMSREVRLSVRASVITVEGVDVYFEAATGPSIVDLELYGQETAVQRSVAGAVDGLGGVSLYLPRKWLPRRDRSRVTFGLELAAGYAWRSKITVRPELLTDDDPIATQSVPLGKLAMHGVAWRMGLFLRFQ